MSEHGGPGDFRDFRDFKDFPFGRGGFPFRDLLFRDLPFRGFPGPGRRRSRANRGDVRAGILALLAEEPRNGYQIITELERRSGGMWRPSPGSVYPALAQLEDEGLVVADPGEGRRTFRLTDEGRAYVDEHADELRAPWEAMAGSVDGGMHELHELLGHTALAAVQVARAGTQAQVAAAKRLLEETRRGLYRILAEDETDDEER